MPADSYPAPPVEVDTRGIITDALVDGRAFVVIPVDQLISYITISNHQTRDKLGNIRAGRSAMYLLRLLKDRGHIRTPAYDQPPQDTR